MANAQKRLDKEKAKLVDSHHHLISDQDKVWIVAIKTAEDGVYGGSTYQLRFAFNDGKYPYEAPRVTFVQPVPVHEHVYGNGHICLSTLYKDWSPAMTVESVCNSVLLMLNAATERKSPADNAQYLASNPSNPKDTRWVYHDDFKSDGV